jgi:hypothetical protein
MLWRADGDPVMRPDQPTEAIRIDKPLETVTSADLFDAAPR